MIDDDEYINEGQWKSCLVITIGIVLLVAICVAGCVLVWTLPAPNRL